MFPVRFDQFTWYTYTRVPIKVIKYDYYEYVTVFEKPRRNFRFALTFHYYIDNHLALTSKPETWGKRERTRGKTGRNIVKNTGKKKTAIISTALRYRNARVL